MRKKSGSSREGANLPPPNAGQSGGGIVEPGPWAKAFKIVGLVGVVFGVNPLAAHAVVYNQGPEAWAYCFSGFVMVIFCGWWILKAFPLFRDIDVE